MRLFRSCWISWCFLCRGRLFGGWRWRRDRRLRLRGCFCLVRCEFWWFLISIVGITWQSGSVTAAGIGKCYAFFTVGATIAKDHDLTCRFSLAHSQLPYSKISGIIHLTVSFNYLDDEAPLFYWTLPECSLAVVCACLPILRPVLKGSWPVSLMRSLTSLLRSNGSSTDGTIITKSGWKNGTPEESKVRVQKVSSSSESGDMVEVQRGDLESGTSDITVHRDFNVHEARGDVQKWCIEVGSFYVVLIPDSCGCN